MRLAFSFQSKYLGMSPWDCPALFTMLLYLERDYGIYHVAGGLNRISAAMAEVIRENGGSIHTAKPVQSLIVENGSVKGVKLTDEEEIRSDAVIVNADFAYAMSNLVPSGQLRKYGAEQLGRSTILFRPPYNADSRPQDMPEVLAIQRAQKLGYLPVSSVIDTQDWGKPGAEAISGSSEAVPAARKRHPYARRRGLGSVKSKLMSIGIFPCARSVGTPPLPPCKMQAWIRWTLSLLAICFRL